MSFPTNKKEDNRFQDLEDFKQASENIQDLPDKRKEKEEKKKQEYKNRDPNPLGDSIDFSDGSSLKWKIKPSVSFGQILKGNVQAGIQNSKVILEFGKTFKDDDVQIDIKINGQPFSLKSPSKTEIFSCEFKATKKF
jgi:hypothetical protein